MEWIKTFFEETSGWGSAMRLIYIIANAWLMVFTTVAVFTHYATFAEATTFFAQNFAALQILKAASKHLETRNK